MKLIATDNCRDFVINDQQAVDDLRHIADCPLDKLTDKDCNDVSGYSQAKIAGTMTRLRMRLFCHCMETRCPPEI